MRCLQKLVFYKRHKSRQPTILFANIEVLGKTGFLREKRVVVLVTTLVSFMTVLVNKQCTKTRRQPDDVIMAECSLLATKKNNATAMLNKCRDRR